jgi:hypothetical protein
MFTVNCMLEDEKKEEIYEYLYANSHNKATANCT